MRELLYGLLLPSGNDAAVALAEHFGARMKPAGDASADADPLPLFIAQMNRVAGELGLRETHFVNPNGLTAPGHQSSARDLARLAHHALALPSFAAYVATRKHDYSLVNAQGQRRGDVWINTNRLLDTEGYDGVKTGTTRAAGECLVASGRRNGDHVIVVILGASSTDALCGRQKPVSLRVAHARPKWASDTFHLARIFFCWPGSHADWPDIALIGLDLVLVGLNILLVGQDRRLVRHGLVELVLVGLDSVLVGKNRRLVGGDLVELLLVLADRFLIGKDRGLIGDDLVQLRLVAFDRFLVGQDLSWLARIVSWFVITASAMVALAPGRGKRSKTGPHSS